MRKRTSCKKKAKKKELQSASGIKQTKAKPGAKVKAAPQPPIAGPSQSVQVQECSDSEDHESNYHEAFDDLEVFFGNPSPARSLVLHCPTNPFAFESTPTWRLQSSTDFEMTRNTTSSPSPYSGYRLPAPDSSPTQSCTIFVSGSIISHPSCIWLILNTSTFVVLLINDVFNNHTVFINQSSP